MTAFSPRCGFCYQAIDFMFMAAIGFSPISDRQAGIMTAALKPA
jgi:hypothetical protein